MKKQITITTFVVIALFIAISAIGCSTDESKNESNQVFAEVLDSVTESISEEVANAVVNELDITEKKSGEITTTDQAIAENIRSFTDLIIHNNKIFTISDNNLFVYNRKSNTEQILTVEDNLYSVVFHKGSIYVGGESLYKLNDTSLEFVDDQYDGTITELYSYGFQLMIGTTDGLYRRGIFGEDKLMDNITVSAITEDNSGLWIGSKGEGLYRWDGDKFQKRFLKRDSSLFDFVNAIDFNHGHLYVGCDNGMYVYNGGKWKTLTTEDGLPENDVKTIDASDWTVYIGTNKGVVGYFEEQLNPVNKLENKQVNTLKVRGIKLIIATEYEGIIEKNGNLLKTLIQPIELENLNILSLVLEDGC